MMKKSTLILVALLSYGGASKALMEGQVAALNDAQINAIAGHIAK